MSDATTPPPAGTLHLQAAQGSRFALRIDLPVGYPIDLSAAGTVVRSTWRAPDARGTVLLALGTVASGAGFYIRSATRVELEIPATTMSGVGVPGATTRGWYDVEIVPGGVDANAIRLLEGVVVISGEATR